MARVVCVHGIAQEYEADVKLLHLWAPALCGGVSNAGGYLAESEIAMAFYGAMFRQAAAKGGHVPSYQAGDVDDGIELELLAEWADAIDAAPADTALHKGLSVQRGAAHMLDAVTQVPFFGEWSERVVIWFLKQVRLYLTDAEVREAAQRALRSVIAPDTRVVVAHSLGSVVAYDVLRNESHPGVGALVTLGSPLGTPTVMRNLVPPISARPAAWPRHVDRWWNIVDQADLVARVKNLSTWFDDRLTDVTVFNGGGSHNVEPYLTARETGAAVLDALKP